MSKFCGQCGTKLMDEALFCFKCGANQSEDYDEEAVSMQKTPTIVKLSTIGDYMYENDYREDLTDTIIEAAGKLSCVRYRNQLSTKQVKNAISFCNNDFSLADIVMVRDTTDFGSMKEGIIITYFGAYYIWDGKLQSKIKFNQIKSVKATTTGVGEMKFTLYDGRENTFRLHTSNDLLPKMFVQICKCIERHRENYPIEIK